jgi:hypothetical protein
MAVLSHAASLVTLAPHDIITMVYTIPSVPRYVLENLSLVETAKAPVDFLFQVKIMFNRNRYNLIKSTDNLKG